MGKVAQATIENKVEAITPEVESIVGGVHTIVHGLVQKELRRAYSEAIDNGDSKVPLVDLVKELETLMAGVQGRLADVKARLQEMVQLELQRAVAGALEGTGVRPGQQAAGGNGNGKSPASEAAGAGAANGAVPAELEGGSRGPREARASGEDVYKGTVRLTVKANGHIRSAIRFLAQLRRKSELRVLQVTGNPYQGTGDIEILMDLREPLDLKEVIVQLADPYLVQISRDSDQDSGELLLSVLLMETSEQPDTTNPSEAVHE